MKGMNKLLITNIDESAVHISVDISNEYAVVKIGDMATPKFVTEILGFIDIKLSVPYMKWQQQFRHCSEEFMKGTGSHNSLEFYLRKKSVCLNHIFIENKTSPASNGRIFSSHYNFYRNFKITYLYTLT